MGKKKKAKALPRGYSMAVREVMKRDGAFDGRFGQRRISDGRKAASKSACRDFRWK